MIKIENVSHRYGKKEVLKDVSFEIRPSEVTCLIGLNGSGKTTLMNLIMKLIPLQNGKISLDDHEISSQDFNRISYIPDQIITLQSMTIQDSLDYMEKYYEVFSPVKASELIEFFKLNRRDKIANLSKGNVAKVNLLLGLSLDTDYVIMDEPFSGIDAISREHIVQVFTHRLIENRGVLITSHELNDIEFLIDQAIIINEGRVVKSFKPEEIRDEEGKSIIDIMREVY